VAKARYRLTTQEILRWAGAHFTRTGRWPTYLSGIVTDAPDEDWSAIDGCLEYGGYGLPGGSSLAYLLARHRGLPGGMERPRLSIDLILVWADRHHIRTGEYPNSRSGCVTGVRDESWGKINRALLEGNRGLPGGSSLEQLLSKHRGKVMWRRRAPRLAINQILAWVDEHRARTGFWPTMKAPMAMGQPGETWDKIDAALRVGRRGMQGGSSLAQLMAKHRGKQLRSTKRQLTAAQILDWADKHRRRTGDWPGQKGGPVHKVPGETWTTIDDALRAGRGGLPGGSSLPALLAKHRGRRHMGQLPPLTLSRILTWAKQHQRRTGSWPTGESGPVAGVSYESWRNVDAALERGGRGLPGRRTLARFLAEHRGITPPSTWPKHRMPRHKMPNLRITRILRWADRYRARTGDWPIEASGTVVEAPEDTWGAINGALRAGYRGLAGGSSLARLLLEKRRKRVRAYAPRLSVTQILRWANEYYRRTGDWPVPKSGPIKGAAPEMWNNIDNALRCGHRGLAGGSSVTALFDIRHGKRRRTRRPPRDRKRTPTRARPGPK